MFSAHLVPMLLLGWLLVSPFTLAASPSELHDRVTAVLEEEGLTGVVWATVHADAAISIDATGLKDARSGQLFDPEDRVHVGSVTKTLLATGVLRLASQGRLALDVPVAEVLPDADFDNPWEASDPVRIRHLLDHTAGIDDLRLWQFFSTRPGPDTPLSHAFSGDDLLRVRSRPGTRFSYSNMGYTLLGRIIESVTGQRYERYLDAHLLRPLGMRDSSFGYVSQQGPQADPRLAMGHFDDGTAHAAVPIYLRPAGQFTTTAGDMGRFARFLMGDGRIDGETFIEPRLLRAMGEPRGTEAATAGLTVGYGLGLATRDRHGGVGRCHGGNIIGYRAMLCVFPEQRRAFFWSANSDSETADYGRLDKLFVDALGVSALQPNRPMTTVEDLAGWQGFYVPEPNRMASFAYVDTVFDFVHVRREGAGLRLNPLQSPATVLSHVGIGLFRAPDRTIASHALLESVDGERVLTTGLQTFERTSVSKLALLWFNMAVGLLGLAWLMLSGFARLLMRRVTPSHPAFVPVLGVVALLLPLPLFLRQSFLQLGDLTLASGVLATVTAVLPLTMLVGTILYLRRGARGPVGVIDLMAMVAVLQWALVLAAWRLLPLRLWT